MPVTTRLATPADAPAIARAHVCAWQVGYRDIVPDDHLDVMGDELAERTEHWAAILRGEVAVEGVRRPIDLVAVSDDEVVGFADVGDHRVQPDGGITGELWAIYVHPDAWGTGAGTALMTAAVAELERAGYHHAHLWVFEANHRARRFYERSGWVDSGIRDDFEIADITITEARYDLDTTSTR